MFTDCIECTEKLEYLIYMLVLSTKHEDKYWQEEGNESEDEGKSESESEKLEEE